MNFAGGRVMSPVRNGCPALDVGAVAKTKRPGVVRGRSTLPYNIILRGLGRRQDTTTPT